MPRYSLRRTARGVVGSLVACAALMAMVIPTGAPVQAAPQAGSALPAVFATGGSGRLVDSIQWLQWADYSAFEGNAAPNVPVLDDGQTRTFTNTRDMGDSGVLETTCTLSGLQHLGHRGDLTDAQAYGPLVATIPGSWAGDGLDNLYNVGGAGQWVDGSEVWHTGLRYPTDYVNRNQMVIGLANGYAYNGDKTWDGQAWGTPGSSSEPTGYTSRVSVDLSCTAALKAPDGTSVPVEIEGLVLADAEASSTRQGTVRYPASGELFDEWGDEWVQASTTQDVTWRLLDRLRSQGCDVTTNAQMSDSGHTVRLAPSGTECVYQGGGRYSSPNGLGGPDAVMLMEGATSATITLQGSGYSAVALGLVISTDYGDAPESYGAASSLFQPDWTGGEVSGTTDLFSMDTLASMSGGSARPMLGQTIDAEGYQDYSEGADSDDLSGADDEDGVTLPPDGIRTEPGAQYNQQVACTVGTVAGWVDWNHNGTFDAQEKSAEATCAGGTATLTWTVPTDVVRSVEGEDVPAGQGKCEEPCNGSAPQFGKGGSSGDTYMRVRVTNDASPLLPTGVTTSGEVEDYRVSVRVPTLQLIKTVDSPYASSEMGGLAPSDWTMHASGGSSNLVGAGGTGAPTTVGGGDLALSEASTVPASQGYAADQWQCVETPGTVGETFASSVTATDAQGRATLSVSNQDRVTCTLLNTMQPAHLTWAKRDARTGEPLAGSTWTLTGPDVPDGTVVSDCTSAPCTAGAYLDQDPQPGRFSLTPLPWGTYAVTEKDAPAGYVRSDKTFTFPRVGATRLETTLEADGPVDESGAVGNLRSSGSVTWTKVDADTGAPLGGSAWALTGPDVPDGTVIADCTGAPCSTDPYADTDPAPGAFRVTGLVWDDDEEYSLVEDTAPAGYQLDDTEHTFALHRDATDYAFVQAFTNAKVTVPSLPMTGGTAGVIFLIAGGSLVAAAAFSALVRRRRQRR